MSAVIESNLYAPTGERTARNESSPGSFGIPELSSPAAMRFPRKPSCVLSADTLPSHEGPAGTFGILGFRSPGGDGIFKNNWQIWKR